MDHLFTAVTAIGVSPFLLIFALLVRGAGSVRIVTFLPHGSNEEVARHNRRVGNVLLLLPLICGGLGSAALVYRDLAFFLMALMVVLFLMSIGGAVVVANLPLPKKS